MRWFVSNVAIKLSGVRVFLGASQFCSIILKVKSLQSSRSVKAVGPFFPVKVSPKLSRADFHQLPIKASNKLLSTLTEVNQLDSIFKMSNLESCRIILS